MHLSMSPKPPKPHSILTWSRPDPAQGGEDSKGDSPAPNPLSVGSPQAPGGHRLAPDQARPPKYPHRSETQAGPREISTCEISLHGITTSIPIVSGPSTSPTAQINDSDSAVTHGTTLGHGTEPPRPHAEPQPRSCSGAGLRSPELCVHHHLAGGCPACSFPSRPICFCSAARGAVPPPEPHAALYKPPRRTGCGEARASPAAAAAPSPREAPALLLLLLSSSSSSANSFFPQLLRALASPELSVAGGERTGRSFLEYFYGFL